MLNGKEIYVKDNNDCVDVYVVVDVYVYVYVCEFDVDDNHDSNCSFVDEVNTVDGNFN